jgi:hypothetical protein
MTNPQRAVDCFLAAGATQIGSMGMADANKGAEEQKRDMDDWISGIWEPIAKVLMMQPEKNVPTREDLAIATL